MLNENLQIVLDEHLCHLDYFQSRIKNPDWRIEQIADSELIIEKQSYRRGMPAGMPLRSDELSGGPILTQGHPRREFI